MERENTGLSQDPHVHALATPVQQQSVHHLSVPGTLYSEQSLIPRRQFSSSISSSVNRTNGKYRLNIQHLFPSKQGSNGNLDMSSHRDTVVTKAPSTSNGVYSCAGTYEFSNFTNSPNPSSPFGSGFGRSPASSSMNGHSRRTSGKSGIAAKAMKKLSATLGRSPNEYGKFRDAQEDRFASVAQQYPQHKEF